MQQRVAIIGADGGIGRACVDAFSVEGWEVIGADQVSQLETLYLDVTELDAVCEFARKSKADALVYAAGKVATMPIATTDFGVWREILAVNLDGAAYAASAFASEMIANKKGGAMVFMSSAAGMRGEANASAYCASKAGLIGLVESLAAELVPHGIRVNAVAPGNVNTPMLTNLVRDIAISQGRKERQVWSEMATTGAANRLIEPAEVANVCVALCSGKFSAVTGTTVSVDAGYLLS